MNVNDRTIIDTAKAELVKLPVDTLVNRLLVSEAARIRSEKDRDEHRRDVLRLEQTVEVTRELLLTELRYATQIADTTDTISVANEARVRLRAVRQEREIPF